MITQQTTIKRRTKMEIGNRKVVFIMEKRGDKYYSDGELIAMVDSRGRVDWLDNETFVSNILSYAKGEQ